MDNHSRSQAAVTSLLSTKLKESGQRASQEIWAFHLMHHLMQLCYNGAVCLWVIIIVWVCSSHMPFTIRWFHCRFNSYVRIAAAQVCIRPSVRSAASESRWFEFACIRRFKLDFATRAYCRVLIATTDPRLLSISLVLGTTGSCRQYEEPSRHDPARDIDSHWWQEPL